jgi:hypothetical protein
LASEQTKLNFQVAASSGDLSDKILNDLPFSKEFKGAQA